MNGQLFIWPAGSNSRKQRPDETEKLSVKKVPFDEVVRMVEDGVITDAMAVAAIQKIQLLVYQGKLKR